jgi:hypothetical protein
MMEVCRKNPEIALDFVSCVLKTKRQTSLLKMKKHIPLILFAFALFQINVSKAQNLDSLAGNNLFFDGSTNYVDTRDTSLYASFTVECWVKSPNAPNSNQGKGPIHYEKNFQINWDHAQSSARNSLVLNVTNGGWQAVSFGPLEANTWYHLAGTYDGDTLRAYTNGRLVSQKIINGGSPVKESFSLKIGKHAKLSGAQEYFNGNVDEVRIWNLARTPDQIRKNIYHPLAGNEPGLKHYYQFKALQSDSAQNLANGKWVPAINNPGIQKSDFPFGKGSTEVFKVQASIPNFFNSSSLGLVSFNVDSSNKAFPLLFSRINAPVNGLKPDSNLFASQEKPYWIFQPLDTGVRYVSSFLRLDQNSIQNEFTMVLSEPRNLKVFNRPLTSAGSWQLVDTCQLIAFGTGHFIFTGFAAGQIMVGVPKELIFATGLVKNPNPTVKGHWDESNQFLLFWEPNPFQTEIDLLEATGRIVQRWATDNASQNQSPQVLQLEYPLAKGIYTLRFKLNQDGKSVGFQTLRLVR